MPRTEEANQQIREEQRAKILNAAIVVFARKGTGATMSEVATAAKVSYGLIYRYYASKEALLVELVEKVMNDSLKALEGALEMPGTPGERLRALLTQVLSGVREHPEFILLVQQMLGEKTGHDRQRESGQELSHSVRFPFRQALRSETAHEHLQELAQEQSRTYRSVLKQLIIEGQKTGEIVLDDPDQLVSAVTACVAGLSQGAAWQELEQFQKNFPDVSIILRMLFPREKEKKNA
jgi:AcrR family transcriptional regulator